MSHVQCLDIDRWYLCTSIDINLHLSRHFMVSIDSTGCASIDCSSSRRPLHVPNFSLALIFSLESKSASISGSVTKIGHASMNQNLMRALKIAASMSRFELFYWSLYESSLNGFSHQVLRYLPDLSEEFDPMYITSPKTSGYVRFSAGNQLWLLHTVKASV
ncbi:hypothetical protein IGI04_035665 [Brassica rapa subsp. trilocularis]|uniref:Uncharacterized protein n=1 Tax=Brassica rapa subsp. trilocularis TaxID=1813537 RepID=A0ABQ7LC93_BRACM|nr:hypothetical protein IGI04_035665 [Brassica rapa subsp. trilocularis]